MSLEELKLITLGPFQLRVAQWYNEHHAPDGSGYEYVVHRRHNQYLRVKLHSRMKSNVQRDVYIKYVPGRNGPGGIADWCCDCPNGARTLGCCGHVAAVSSTYRITVVVSSYNLVDNFRCYGIFVTTDTTNQFGEETLMRGSWMPDQFAQQGLALLVTIWLIRKLLSNQLLLIPIEIFPYQQLQVHRAVLLIM